jgi:hypothetical protein
VKPISSYSKEVGCQGVTPSNLGTFLKNLKLNGFIRDATAKALSSLQAGALAVKGNGNAVYSEKISLM